MRSIENNSAYFSYLPTNQIKPNVLNPRKHFDEKEIEELAQSFREYGIIQPVIVYSDNAHFRIICGERRWKAAQLANLMEMPAVVHPSPPSNETAISLALIENLHRKDVDVLS